MTALEDLFEAFARLQRRKAASGITAATVVEVGTYPGIMSGTDLTEDDFAEFTLAIAARMLPSAIRMGPVLGTQASIVEGILIGLELTRLRAEHEAAAAR